MVGACGPDSAEDEVDCERDATIPILRVAPNELVVPYGRMGESWMFVVASYDVDVRPMLANDEEWIDAVDHRVVTTNDCDDDPRTVAIGLDDLESPPRPDLPWVARSARSVAEDDLWILDPARDGNPHRVTGGFPGQYVWTQDALWMLEGDSSPGYDLVKVSLTASELAKEPLRSDVHGIARPAGPQLVRSAVAIESGGAVIVLDAESGDEVWRRSALHGAYVFDSDAQVILAVEETEAFVVNRFTGTQIRLERSPLTLFESESGALWVPLVEDGEEFTRIVLLPEMIDRRLPGRWSCTKACDSPRRVLEGPDGLYLLDGPMAEPRLLHAGVGEARIVEDRVELVSYEPPTSADVSPLELEHRESAYSFDGSAIVDDRFGRAVLDSIALEDQRWAYVRAADDEFGELVLFDGSSEELVLIADDVLPMLDAWRAEPAAAWSEPRSEFIYITYEEDETTVWLAHAERLP